MMTRERLVAHLALHGWVPYQESTFKWKLLWNAEARAGIAYDGVWRRGEKEILAPPPEWECEWSDIPDDVLRLMLTQMQMEGLW